MAKITKDLIKHGVTINKINGEQQGKICIALGRNNNVTASAYKNVAYLEQGYFVADDSYSGKNAKFNCVKSGWYTFQTIKSGANVYIKKNGTTIYTALNTNSFTTQRFESGDTLLFDTASGKVSYLCSVYFLTD